MLISVKNVGDQASFLIDASQRKIIESLKNLHLILFIFIIAQWHAQSPELPQTLTT